MVTVTHPADSDGINEILEGAHRAVSTGAMRLTELLAWRGRDRAYDRAATANAQLDQALSEDLTAQGRRVLAEEMAGRNVSITDPDDRHSSPAYDGPVAGAANRLTDGTYTAVDDAGNTVTVVVADGQSGAVGPADYMERATMQAQVQAALDGRDAFTAEDVDNVLYGWASQRAVRGNDPDGYDGEYWRTWAVMEADDSQLADVTYYSAEEGTYHDRVAAAHANLQGQVAQAARADNQWRSAANARAAGSAAHLHEDGRRQSAQARGPFTRQTSAAHQNTPGQASTGHPDVDEALVLHDLTFAGREAHSQTRRRGKPAAARSRSARRGTNPTTDRGMTR